MTNNIACRRVIDKNAIADTQTRTMFQNEPYAYNNRALDADDDDVSSDDIAPK
jgi:hypothetical protein